MKRQRGKTCRELCAFQGERGAFSEVASRQLLGEEIEFLPCQRFEQVFRSLADGQVSAAVIPIENTLHGSVHENYDHLLHFGHRIVAETNVRIVHNLIALPGVKRREIRQVYSHPVALNQCLDFFASNPDLEKLTFYDTAGSVKMLRDEDRHDAGAIASAIAADLYGCHILKRSIEDDRRNFTRFFLLRPAGYEGAPPATEGHEMKTCLVFTTRNTPGALFRSLSAFALRDLSLTKIESRPLRGKPWEYLFYLDFLSQPDDPRVEKALGHLAELADFMKILGTFPKAV